VKYSFRVTYSATLLEMMLYEELDGLCIQHVKLPFDAVKLVNLSPICNPNFHFMGGVGTK
jgi:hypothetical protein